jgi:hypothetical protein
VTTQRYGDSDSCSDGNDDGHNDAYSDSHGHGMIPDSTCPPRATCSLQWPSKLMHCPSAQCPGGRVWSPAPLPRRSMRGSVYHGICCSVRRRGWAAALGQGGRAPSAGSPGCLPPPQNHPCPQSPAVESTPRPCSGQGSSSVRSDTDGHRSPGSVRGGRRVRVDRCTPAR